jgi:hypothetical protein
MAAGRKVVKPHRMREWDRIESLKAEGREILEDRGLGHLVTGARHRPADWPGRIIFHAAALFAAAAIAGVVRASCAGEVLIAYAVLWPMISLASRVAAEMPLLPMAEPPAGLQPSLTVWHVGRRMIEVALANAVMFAAGGIFILLLADAAGEALQAIGLPGRVAMAALLAWATSWPGHRLALKLFRDRMASLVPTGSL